MNQINIHEVERLFYKGLLRNQIFLRFEKAFERIKWLQSYEVYLSEKDRKADIQARREVNKFLTERIRVILIDGFEVPRITARYAIQNQLAYRKEYGGYENASV